MEWVRSCVDEDRHDVLGEPLEAPKLYRLSSELSFNNRVHSGLIARGLEGRVKE